MKQIKITRDNTDKLEQVLNNKQGRARVRRVEVTDVLEAAERAEQVLIRLGLPVKMRPGASLLLNLHAQNFARAYNGVPMTTYIHLTRRAAGWYLDGVSRRECGNRRESWSLSAEQRDKITERFFDNHGIIGGAA